MISRIHAALVVAACAGTGIGHASQLSLGAATGYNAFVFSNFTETGTDSEGKLAVGGNFAPANGGSFTIASHHGTDGAGIYDLVVGGSFTNQYASLGGGDAFVGGNMTWLDPTLPHNVYVDGNFMNSANGGSVGGTVFYSGSYSSGDPLNNVHQNSAVADPIDFLGAKTSLQSLSNTLAAQQANGNVSNNGYNTYTLTGTSTGMNVFDLTDTSYSGSTINITVPAGSTVIVNVPGASDSFSGGSININGVPSNDVIFNFNTASALSIGSMAFNGTILAPNAAFTGTWGQLNGQLIANSAAGTTELHDVLFSGNMAVTGGTGQTPTPEPATWATLLIGFALIALGRKR